MIESVIAAVSLRIGTSMLAALVEGRDLNGQDASSVVTALLGSMVTGMQDQSTQLNRLEEKVDDLAGQRYRTSLQSGYIFLEDACPAHRAAADRARMLGVAQEHFAGASRFSGV